jgi:hypothetical protein
MRSVRTLLGGLVLIFSGCAVAPPPAPIAAVQYPANANQPPYVAYPSVYPWVYPWYYGPDITVGLGFGDGWNGRLEHPWNGDWQGGWAHFRI